jgi:hypothetical protein
MPNPSPDKPLVMCSVSLSEAVKQKLLAQRLDEPSEGCLGPVGRMLAGQEALRRRRLELDAREAAIKRLQRRHKRHAAISAWLTPGRAIGAIVGASLLAILAVVAFNALLGFLHH